MIRSLRLVAERVGRSPTIDDYRAAQAELVAAGEDVEPFRRLYRYLDRSCVLET